MKTERFLMGRHREELSQVEVDILEASHEGIVHFAAGKGIVRRGERVDRSLFLVEGFISRYMDGVDGGRQLVALHVAGDFVDLHGFPMRRLDHDVEALTDCTMVRYAHETVQRLVLEFPNLGRLFWFSTLLDAAMHREWIFRLGRLDAIGRMAHMFAETGRRLEMVGLSDGLTYALPFHQSDLAEVCGITPVHANRVLRKLRERGIVRFAGGVVTVDDLAELHRIAEFDDGYLYPSPR